MKEIMGGITAPKGYRAAGVACGIKKENKKDLALLVTAKTAAAAGVYTKNIVKGHSLQLTIENMKTGLVDAVLINSGCANACVGERGYQDALEITSYCAKRLNSNPSRIVFGSTGVIGVPLNKDAIIKGIDACIEQLSENGGREAATAIMTTDTVCKETAVEFAIGGKTVRIGGMAKGSGMIHPNMATMISVITTDACISRNLLEELFRKITDKTFNRISVDGDTSVCDMAIILANGMAGNQPIEAGSQDYDIFAEALYLVCEKLSKMLARDGEGASKLIEIVVEGAGSAREAHEIAVAIAKSPLVKTAVFGEDANWGRIITAAGYSGVNFDPDKVDIYIGDILTCLSGVAQAFDEEKAREVLKKGEVKITVNLNSGNEKDRMWTCDFSYDYVRINASYRS